MKKIFGENIKGSIVEAVIFLTLFITLGNSLVDSIVEKNIRYLIYGLSVWFIQFLSTAVLFVLLLIVVRVILYLVKQADLKKGNQGEKDEKKTV